MSIITIGNIKQISGLWDEVLTRKNHVYPFDDWRWHHLWFDTIKPTGQPIQISFKDRLIAPFIIHDGVALWSGGNEISDYQDLIGPDDQYHDAWKHCLDALRSLHVSRLDIHNVPDQSPTISFFRSLPERSVTIENEDTTPKLSLPSNWNDYIMNLDRHNRHELRRKRKKFETLYPSSEIQIITDITAIHILLDLMDANTDKHHFLTHAYREFFLRLPDVFPSNCSMHVLRVNSVPIAATLGFLTDNSFLLYNSGYLPSYPGAGWYLKMKTIEWAIDNNITCYNFLQGNERYKFDFGAIDFPVYHIMYDYE